VGEFSHAAVVDSHVDRCSRYLVGSSPTSAQMPIFSSEGFPPRSWHPFSPSGLATRCNIYLSLIDSLSNCGRRRDNSMFLFMLAVLEGCDWLSDMHLSALALVRTGSWLRISAIMQAVRLRVGFGRAARSDALSGLATTTDILSCDACRDRLLVF